MTPLSELLTYRAFCPIKGLFYSAASAGFMVEVSPLVGCTEAMQREIAGLFGHTLPEGSSAQFMLWADPRVGTMLDDWHAQRVDRDPIFQELARRRVSFLKERVFNPDHPLRNFRCIISVSLPGPHRALWKRKTFSSSKIMW